jgi:hypothetical protein
MVEASMRREPSLMPLKMPFSEVYTSCTCGEEGSMVTS